MNNKSIFGDVISVYTREQALKDGTLVDVSAMAREVGYKYPTVITASIQALIEIAVANEKFCNDYKGVLWDILYMSVATGKISKDDPSRKYYKVIIKGVDENIEEYDLIAHCGPGDDGEPVITIMQPIDD